MEDKETCELLKKRKELVNEYISQFDSLSVQENEYYLQNIKDIDKELKKLSRKIKHE